MEKQKRTVSFGRMIALGALLMVCGSVAMIAVGLIATKLAGGNFTPDNGQQYLFDHPWPGLFFGMIAEGLVGFFGYRLLIRTRERRQPIELSGPKFGRELAAGFGVGTVFIAAIMAVLYLSGAYHPTGVTWSTGILVGLGLGVGAAFLEESVFRGVLLRVLDKKYGPVVAISIVAVVFGLIHIVNGLATGEFSLWGALSIIVEAGVLLNAAYYLTRRLWFVIGVHMAWNFTLGGIFGQIVSGINPHGGLITNNAMSGPAWLTGGDFGPEGSVVTVVLGLIVGLLLFKIAKDRGNLVLRKS